MQPTSPRSPMEPVAFGPPARDPRSPGGPPFGACAGPCGPATPYHPGGHPCHPGGALTPPAHGGYLSGHPGARLIGRSVSPTYVQARVVPQPQLPPQECGTPREFWPQAGTSVCSPSPSSNGVWSPRAPSSPVRVGRKVRIEDDNADDLETALVPPQDIGVVGNCYVCLPAACVKLLKIQPNIDDKGAPSKELWFGRVWQLRVLGLNHYRKNVLAKQEPLTSHQRQLIEFDLRDPRKRALMAKIQARWRGGVVRRTGSLRCALQDLEYCMAPYAGTVIFMHGSGGMTYNNVRYMRTLAALGFIAIGPDSMAGGEYRKKNVAGIIRSNQPTPYWDDLGLYTSSASGEFTYDTKAEEVVKNPEKYKKLYENVFRMRSAEMRWILRGLPFQMKVRGVFTMGQSEGAMTVARFDDRRYGAMIRGRIISAFSVEYCYFTPVREASTYGGDPEVATLNIIGDADQYFGNIKSVAKDVSLNKQDGGWGETDLTGNGFREMKRQKLTRGLVVVLQGAKHDASETHDNFLRDLLRAFLASPHECHRIAQQWKPDPYLSSKVKVIETDTSGHGKRVLMHVGKMDLPSTTEYGVELFKRRNIVQAFGKKRTLTPNGADRGAFGRDAGQQSYGYEHAAREPGRITPHTGYPRGSIYPNGFNALLSRGNNALFGFRVAADWSQGVLIIDWLDEAGSVGSWNAQHPAMTIRPGDRLLEVNSVRNDPEGMRNEILNSTSLTLLVAPGSA